MVGKPKKEQDQEAIELIEKLKEKLGCKTDTELANIIGVDKTHVSRWKIRGFTEVNKGFIRLILRK